MSFYKQGLGIGTIRVEVGGEKEGPKLSTMVAAGVISGVVLLAISKATSNKKLAITGPSREALAFKESVTKWRAEGIPWT